MRKRLLASAVLVLASLPCLAQEPYEQFLTKFAEAVKGDNYAVMKDQVVRNKELIFPAWMTCETQLCSAVSNKSEEDKTSRTGVLDKLATFVNQEYKDRFYIDRLAWVKTLTPEQCVKRMQITETITEGDRLFRGGEKSGDQKAFQDARARFDKVMPLAEEIKDTYWKIDLHIWQASVSDKLGEKFESAYWYKRAMEIGREEKAIAQITKFDVPSKLKHAATAAGLRDDFIDVTVPPDQSKKKYTELMEKKAAEQMNPGAADSKPAAGGGTGGGSKAAMPGTLPPMANKHTMRVEWADAEKPKYEEITARPVPTANVRANGLWFLWNTQEVAPGAGTKSNLVPGDHLFKNDKGKILFNPGGAKAADEKLKIAVGKPEMNVFKGRAFPDGSKVDVHHLLMEAPRAFQVNGLSMNFKAPGPNDKLPLVWVGATAVATKFAGYDITIYDDNGNGDFSTWGEDSIVISQKGKVLKSMPLSRYVYLGDLLFEMKIDPNGTNIRFKPYDGPVALLQFEWVAKSDPLFMILEGQNENAQFYVNLMDCKDKPIWVPPGEYKFRNGYFMFGEGDKRETIDVLNSGKCSTVKVVDGSLNKVQMGGAKAPGFTCTWKAEQEKEKGKTVIKLHGKDIKIYGCAGEEYLRLCTGQFRPTVKMRAGKEGAFFYDKEMRNSAKEDLTTPGGGTKPWDQVAFFPKDIDVEKTVSGDVFITLEGDYPKLGKITSQPSQVE